MLWQPGDIAFTILDDATDDPIVTAVVETPAGQLLMMAECHVEGRTLRVRRLHVQGEGANSVGAGNLRAIADIVMEGMDFDALEVEGALRTTGATPGRRPRAFRFARRTRASPDC